MLCCSTAPRTVSWSGGTWTHSTASRPWWAIAVRWGASYSPLTETKAPLCWMQNQQLLIGWCQLANCAFTSGCFYMYIYSCILTRLVRKVAACLIFATSLHTKTTELPELLWRCVFSCVCLCVSGVGHGAAEPGEQAVNRLSGQWTSSLGHQLPAGGESGCLLLCFLCPTDAENSRPPFPNSWCVKCEWNQPRC